MALTYENPSFKNAPENSTYVILTETIMKSIPRMVIRKKDVLM